MQSVPSLLSPLPYGEQAVSTAPTGRREPYHDPIRRPAYSYLRVPSQCPAIYAHQPTALAPFRFHAAHAPRRIGTHRTALLGLSGQRIDAVLALDWGLIDAVE